MGPPSQCDGEVTKEEYTPDDLVPPSSEKLLGANGGRLLRSFGNDLGNQ